jgi:Family of unknown function (DUF6263)
MKKMSVLLVCFITVQAFAQTINVEVGRKITMHNKITGVSAKPEMMGGGEVKTETELFASVEILSKDEQNYTVKYTGTRLINKNEDMGDLDSDKKEDLESDRGKIFFKGINEPKIKLIDINTGKVADDKKIVTANAEIEKSESKTIIKTSTKESGNILDNLFFVIAADKKVGDKWTVDKSEGDLKIIKTYELKSIENGTALIAFTSSLTGTTNIETNGMTIQRNEDTKGKGTIMVDIKTSMVKKIVSELETEGSMEVMGNSTPMSSKRTSVTEFN